MKMPAVRFSPADLKLPDLPKPVMISVIVIAGTLIFFLLLLFTLGAARDTAENDVNRLRNEVTSTQTNLRQAKDDYDFVLKNQERFESLMASDKLIPHTRRTAIRQMQALALEFGLSALNYNFQAAGLQAPEAVTAQPKTGSYRVYVENIELTVGAPLDQAVYSFIAAMHDDFPGAMVMLDFELARAPSVTTEALNMVSRGQDSKLVSGKIRYSWRTAQKEEEKK